MEPSDFERGYAKGVADEHERIVGTLHNHVLAAETAAYMRAAQLLEQVTSDWGRQNGIKDWPMIKEAATAIRAQAASPSALDDMLRQARADELEHLKHWSRNAWDDDAAEHCVVVSGKDLEARIAELKGDGYGHR